MRLANPPSALPLSIAAAALLAMGAAAPAGAALQISTRTLPPTGPQVVVASPVPADAGEADVYLWTHGTGTAVGVGQTFRLGTPVTLDRITVRARPLTAQVAGETVVLTLAGFAGPADVTPGEILAVASATLPQALAVGIAVYLVFDLDDLDLEADRQYGFLLEFAGGGHVNDARVELSNVGADRYAGGRPFLHEGAFYDAEDDDLVFYLEGVVDGECEVPPPGEALVTSELPGFRFWVRFGDPASATWWGEAEPLCTPETLCVSGALPGRTEVFLRVIGPRPNGYLWPTMVKLSTSRVEVWFEQTSTGVLRCYVLAGAVPGSTELPGLFDRTGFLP